MLALCIYSDFMKTHWKRRQFFFFSKLIMYDPTNCTSLYNEARLHLEYHLQLLELHLNEDIDDLKWS